MQMDFEGMACLVPTVEHTLEGFSMVLGSLLRLLQHEAFRPTSEQESNDLSVAVQKLETLRQRFEQQKQVTLSDLKELDAALLLFSVFLVVNISHFPSDRCNAALDTLWNLHFSVIEWQRDIIASQS
jgi:hypothetical protein